MKKMLLAAVLFCLCAVLCACSFSLVQVNSNSGNDYKYTNNIPAISIEQDRPAAQIPVIQSPIYITSEYLPLDDVLFPILNEIISDDMTDKEKLEAVYAYLMQYSYQERALDIPQEKQQYAGQIYALSLLENGYGIYCDFSAAFKYMALAISYDVKITEGYHSSDEYPTSEHNWATVELDGTVYIFDPAIEIRLRQDGHRYGRTRFMKTYLEIGKYYSYQ